MNLGMSRFTDKNKEDSEKFQNVENLMENDKIK
jgi:hypothetical protein